jgi:hypothetical protein
MQLFSTGYDDIHRRDESQATIACRDDTYGAAFYSLRPLDKNTKPNCCPLPLNQNSSRSITVALYLCSKSQPQPIALPISWRRSVLLSFALALLETKKKQSRTQQRE